MVDCSRRLSNECRELATGSALSSTAPSWPRSPWCARSACPARSRRDAVRDGRAPLVHERALEVQRLQAQPAATGSTRPSTTAVRRSSVSLLAAS